MAFNPRSVQNEIQSSPSEQQEEMDLETIKLATYLLVGAVLEGSDELIGKLKSRERELTEPEIFHGAKIPGETSKDLIRYATIGFLIDSSERLSRTISTVGHASNRVAGLFFRALKPITHSRVMRPTRRRFNQLVASGEDLVDSWIDNGRFREKESREITRQALVIIVDDFLDYLSTNKGIQDLVQEQGLSMGEEAITEIRGRSADADAIAEQIFNAILRRRSQKTTQTNFLENSGSNSTGSGDMG